MRRKGMTSRLRRNDSVASAFPIFMRDPSQMCGETIALRPNLVPSLTSSGLNFNFGDVALPMPSTNQTCVSRLRERAVVRDPDRAGQVRCQESYGLTRTLSGARLNNDAFCTAR